MLSCQWLVDTISCNPPKREALNARILLRGPGTREETGWQTPRKSLYYQTGMRFDTLVLNVDNNSEASLDIIDPGKRTVRILAQHKSR